MTEQRPSLKTSRTTGEGACESLALSRPEFKNETLPAPDTSTETNSLKAIVEPRERVGIIIACLLGAVPIIALALVRWQSQEPEDPREPLKIAEAQAVPTQVVDSATPAAIVPKPAIAERDPELIDTSLEPREAPAEPAQASHAKSTATPARATQPSGDHSLAPKATPPCPAPVQSAWFEYR